MYWHKSKLVLHRVNPLSVQRALRSTVVMALGADGLRKCVTLQTVRTLSA